MENQNQTEETYEKIYREFLTQYKNEEIAGETVGILIVKMAQYFAEKNKITTIEEIALNKVASEIIQTVDENTNKQITVAKAEIVIKSTPEANDLKMAKMHLANIENYINALKYLQKSLTTEQGYMGGA